MPTDVNTLLFTHCAIQTSPADALKLNTQAPIEFIDQSVESGARYGYQVVLTGYSEHVRNRERKTNEYRQLLIALKALRANPRPHDGRKLKGSVTTFRTKNDYYQLDYRVHSGQVEVYNIQPTDKLQRARDKLEKAAIYKVEKDSSGSWSVSHMVKGGKVDTQHAAVNGQSNNLAKATWLMGCHLEHAYGKNFTEYTLFHNPSVGGKGDTWESIQDKFGFTTDVTKKFADMLEKAQQKGSETRWVAHSQGGLIFAEGVRYLLNNKSSWALNQLSFNGARSATKGTLLDQQKVTFHGNANNNQRSKLLFERAGVEVLDTVGHDYDLVTNIIGFNTLNPRKLVGSLIHANHVFRGSVAQSPHTTVQTRESWDDNMMNGPGKGRGPLQKAFNAAEAGGHRAVNAIKNFLP